MSTENNTQLSIATIPFDACRPRPFEAQIKRLMHFKATASYAVKIIEAPQNYTFSAWGSPMWKPNRVEDIRIHDATGTEVARFSWSGIEYYVDIKWFPELYAAVMYVTAAMREARERVRALGNQEMTPSEIEKEFNLARGTVRKYIHDHREMLMEAGVVRKADQRTLLCKRGWAICRWGE